MPPPPSPPHFPDGNALLVAHPETPGGPIHEIRVSWTWCADALALRFRLAGELDHLALPPHGTPGAADRLWEHTCCEAFLAPMAEPRYREFNFSPSGQWAVYDFVDYRQPAPGSPSRAFAIGSEIAGGAVTLTVAIPAAVLPVSEDGLFDLGMSCVVEDTRGQRYYWALAHPASRPDFHRREAFALRLPPAPFAISA